MYVHLEISATSTIVSVLSSELYFRAASGSPNQQQGNNKNQILKLTPQELVSTREVHNATST
jgi:hypothetical protein